MLMLLSQKKKVEKAKELIKKTLNECKNPYISTSWGKDSTVVMDLVHNEDPTVPIVYMDSGYAMPDTYEYRDRYLAQSKAHYYEIKCPQDYLDLSLKYGLPHIDRTQKDHDKIIKMIKGEPITDFAKSKGFDCCFWGIRADETRGRAYLLKKYGLNHNDKCAPIGFWTTYDIWAYILSKDIDYNTLYDKEIPPAITRYNIKNSGWLTTDNIHKGRLLWLKRFYPDIFDKLKEINPQVGNYL